MYALYDYNAVNDDELSFHDGDLITVIRKGDDKYVGVKSSAPSFFT